MNGKECRFVRKNSMLLLASHLRNVFFLEPKVKANGWDPRKVLSQTILWLEVFFCEKNSILLANNKKKHLGYQEVSCLMHFLLE